jgi:nucleoside-diphosphate-sugar epimerase
MKETVLITGGAGYVGAPLAANLLDAGYAVAVIDNLRYGGEALLNICNRPNFSFHKVDIRDKGVLERVFSEIRIDHVVHLAAIVGDPACAKDPALSTEVNWNGSMNLLECAQKNGIKRFVFASTCSNYGKMKDPDGCVDETSSLAPVSLYAQLKVKFENVILNEIEKRPDFCPVALRFSTVHGLSPRMRFDLTVNEFTKELALGRNLEVFGEHFWRPYCHVQDYSHAIELVLACHRDRVAYSVFNVGDDSQNYQKRMIVDEIRKFIPNAQVNYVNRGEDPRDYRVSFEKIRDVLGFRITRKVPDGIREVIKVLHDGMIGDPDHARYSNV